MTRVRLWARAVGDRTVINLETYRGDFVVQFMNDRFHQAFGFTPPLTGRQEVEVTIRPIAKLKPKRKGKKK
jgi:hypothetical protein